MQKQLRKGHRRVEKTIVRDLQPNLKRLAGISATLANSEAQENSEAIG